MTWVGKYYHGGARRRAIATAERLLPLVRAHESILDVGAGDGLVAAELRSRIGGYTVLVDLKSQAVDSLPMAVGSGEQLPFQDAAFDVVLLLTVLHHTRHPASLICEAARVAKRAVIVQEDMYTGRLVDLLVFAADVLGSIAHGYELPSAPRSPRAWEQLFRVARIHSAVKILDYWSVGPICRAGTVIWSLDRC